MKKLLILAAILLAGCSSGDQTSSLSIHEVKDCMKRLADTEYYGLDTLRPGVQRCAFSLEDKMIEPAFYNFYGCAMEMANPMHDLPPEVTSFSYRHAIYRCIAQYPGEMMFGIPEQGANLVKVGEKVRVLHGDTLMECYWEPTAIGYSEDVVCR